MSANRQPLDALAESMRRNQHGLIRPLWCDLDAGKKEFWLNQADVVLRALREFGFDVTERAS